MSAKKVNWDQLLEKIHKECIAINDVDYKKAKEIFDVVLEVVKNKMAEQCNYFKKNSKQVMYAGSVYDGIKVSKLDEFDMDIVINLPVNYSKDDIVIESDEDHPGFVKMKIGQAFDILDNLPNWEKCNKVTRHWRDSDKYVLQNKFRSWMQGIVQKALNQLNGQVTVKGETYDLAYKESGPAFTLKLNVNNDEQEFNLDVDLVPVIRLQHPRWPDGYRQLEENTVEDWLVVPKPNKDISDDKLRHRYWRLSFQEFERDMMKSSHQLKSTIRLVKKLRDTLNINIASYYIKTLFLWKIHEKKNNQYWKQGLGVLFRTMVEEFYKALKNRVIPYFWQEQKNLISHMAPDDLEVYAGKLKEVVDAIDRNDVIKVVSSLVNSDELRKYTGSDFLTTTYTKPSNASKSTMRRPETNPSTSSAPQKEHNQNTLFNDNNAKNIPDEFKTLFCPDTSNIGSDSKASEDSEVKNVLQNLKEKIRHKLCTIINEKYSFHETNQNDPEKVSDDKDGVVIEILMELQDNIDKLANTKYDQDEIMKLANKISMLVDKTEEHGDMLKRLEMTDSEYKQKYIELAITIADLTGENQALKKEVEEAEARGTLQTIVYSTLFYIAGRFGPGRRRRPNN